MVHVRWAASRDARSVANPWCRVATMNTNKTSAPAKETWSVTVLYQDAEVRPRALQACDHLMQQFWSEIEFDFNWWRFSFLEESETAAHAARHLENSDAIVIAVQSDGELPAAIAEWLDQAMIQRGIRGGVFIALFGPQSDDSAQADAAKNAHLSALAHRSGMDYLTEVLEMVRPGGLPDSLDHLIQRAEEHSSILDNILKDSFLLNWSI